MAGGRSVGGSRIPGRGAGAPAPQLPRPPLPRPARSDRHAAHQRAHLRAGLHRVAGRQRRAGGRGARSPVPGHVALAGGGRDVDRAPAAGAAGGLRDRRAHAGADPRPRARRPAAAGALAAGDGLCVPRPVRRVPRRAGRGLQLPGVEGDPGRAARPADGAAQRTRRRDRGRRLALGRDAADRIQRPRQRLRRHLPGRLRC